MKQFFTILVLLGFLVQLSGKVFIYTAYQVKKDYISSTLCENRTEPELECEGKCFLKKELEKEEKQSSNQNNNQKDKTETFICETFRVLSFEPAFLNKAIPLLSISHLQDGHLKAIFHPPLV